MQKSISELKKVTFSSEYCYLFFQKQTGIKLSPHDFSKDIRGCMIDIGTLEKCDINSSGSVYMYQFIRQDNELYDLYCEFVKKKLNEKYPIGTVFEGNNLWEYPKSEKINDNILIHSKTGMFYYRADEYSYLIPLMSVDYSGYVDFHVRTVE